MPRIPASLLASPLGFPLAAARAVGRPFAFALVLMLVLTACDRAPSGGNLKEWTPSDHDGEQKSGAAASASKQGTRGAPNGPGALVEVTWRNQCATCHGVGGRGDGPQGPMFKPPDLTSAEWQGKLKDEEVAQVIVTGKGRMPKFDLPPEIVAGLVKRIRGLGGK